MERGASFLARLFVHDLGFDLRPPLFEGGIARASFEIGLVRRLGLWESGPVYHEVQESMLDRGEVLGLGKQ